MGRRRTPRVVRDEDGGFKRRTRLQLNDTPIVTCESGNLRRRFLYSAGLVAEAQHGTDNSCPVATTRAMPQYPGILVRSALVWSAAFVCACVVAAGGASLAGAQQAPELVFDPTWPKDLPNNWKLGGVTGLALDRDENVWLYNRPNDLTNIELHAELEPALALCCVRAPSMIVMRDRTLALRSRHGSLPRAT